MNSDYTALFNSLHPGFFDRDYIQAISPEYVCEEMILDLRKERLLPVDEPAGNITYGFFSGDFDTLHEAVREVSPDWVQYFGRDERIYCAYSDGVLSSFCLIDDMGVHDYAGCKVRVAGPGCVGTVPRFRRRGIGLSMVRRATEIIAGEGYDLSYIHYTGVAHWYAGLGYHTILRWNSLGIIE